MAKCHDCTYMSDKLSPHDNRDECERDRQCNYSGRWEDPYNGGTCSHFEDRHRSKYDKIELKETPKSITDCYLTTAMCQILEFQDNAVVLESMRALRDTYMVTKEEHTPILKEYREIGPIVSKKMKEDENKTRTAHVMLAEYLNPAYKHIQNNEPEEAIDIYINMTIDLMLYYGLTDEIENCETTIGPAMAKRREII